MLSESRKIVPRKRAQGLVSSPCTALRCCSRRYRWRPSLEFVRSYLANALTRAAWRLIRLVVAKAISRISPLELFIYRQGLTDCLRSRMKSKSPDRDGVGCKQKRSRKPRMRNKKRTDPNSSAATADSKRTEAAGSGGQYSSSTLTEERSAQCGTFEQLREKVEQTTAG